MSNVKLLLKRSLLPILCISMAFGQGSGYLAQKLMVENDLRQRITDALSKIIDDRKYVIDVDAEIEISGILMHHPHQHQANQYYLPLLHCLHPHLQPVTRSFPEPLQINGPLRLILKNWI